MLPIYLEPGVDRYLIYWLACELGSKYVGNWKIRVRYLTKICISRTIVFFHLGEVDFQCVCLSNFLQSLPHSNTS